MAGAWCRQVVATLAAGGMLAAAATGEQPLRSVRAGESTLSLPETEAMRFLAGKHSVNLPGGLSCSRVEGFAIYRLADAPQGAPALIIIHPVGREAERQELARVAERYLRLSGFAHYQTHLAVDGSVAFLLRNDAPPAPAPRRRQTFAALSGQSTLLPTILWLNAVCGGVPERMEEGALVWRRPAEAAGQAGELEISLPLLHGAPCYLGLRLRRLPARAMEAVLADALQLRLEAPRRATYLKSHPRVRVAGLAEEKWEENGHQRRVRLCLLQPQASAAHYHLGERTQLPAHYEDGRINAAPSLPQMADMPWADELPLVAPKPAPAEGTPAAPAPAPQPTPAEARKAYAERLRAL